MDPTSNLRQRLSVAGDLLRPGSPSCAEGVVLARLTLTCTDEPSVEMRRLARLLVERDDPSSELAELVLAAVRWATMKGFHPVSNGGSSPAV